MIRNNLLAVVLHVVIVPVYYVSVTVLSALFHLHEPADQPVVWGCTLLAVVLYVVVGYVAQDQGSAGRNLLSVLSPAVLLVAALAIDPFADLASGVNLTGLRYALANVVFTTPIPVTGLAASGKNVLAIVLAFLPTLLFWIGLQLKSWRQARKGRTEASR